MRTEADTLDARNSVQTNLDLWHLTVQWHDLPARVKQSILATVQRYARTPDREAVRRANSDIPTPQKGSSAKPVRAIKKVLAPIPSSPRVVL